MDSLLTGMRARRLLGRADAGGGVFAARAGSARVAGDVVRGEEPGDRRALARHGVAGGLRPAALGAGQPAVRSLVRRTGDDLPPRRRRGAARPLPPELGRVGARGEPRAGRPLFRRLPHPAGPGLEPEAGRRRRRAARLGRPALGALRRQAPAARPDGLRRHAHRLRHGARALGRRDRVRRRRLRLAAAPRRRHQGDRRQPGAAAREADARRGRSDDVGADRHPARTAERRALRLRLRRQRHAGDRRLDRSGRRGAAPRRGGRVPRVRRRRRGATARGRARLPHPGAHRFGGRAPARVGARRPRPHAPGGLRPRPRGARDPGLDVALGRDRARPRGHG